MSKMHMKTPIWVWLYDFGPHTHPEMWTSGCKIEALPQTHSYAFTSEEEALAHPKAMNWKPNHEYILEKTWLQTDEGT